MPSTVWGVAWTVGWYPSSFRVAVVRGLMLTIFAVLQEVSVQANQGAGGGGARNGDQVNLLGL